MIIFSRRQHIELEAIFTLAQTSIDLRLLSAKGSYVRKNKMFFRYSIFREPYVMLTFLLCIQMMMFEFQE